MWFQGHRLIGDSKMFVQDTGMAFIHSDIHSGAPCAYILGYTDLSWEAACEIRESQLIPWYTTCGPVILDCLTGFGTFCFVFLCSNREK